MSRFTPVKQPDGSTCYSGPECKLHGAYNRIQKLQKQISTTLALPTTFPQPEIENNRFTPTPVTISWEGLGKASFDREELWTKLKASLEVSYPSGFRVEVSKVVEQEINKYPENRFFDYNVEFFDNKGNNVGKAYRLVFPSSHKVEHADLSLDAGYRGNGFIDAFLSQSEEMYKAMGLTHIITDAKTDPEIGYVGAYVWAKKWYFDFDGAPTDLINEIKYRLWKIEDEEWQQSYDSKAEWHKIYPRLNPNSRDYKELDELLNRFEYDDMPSPIEVTELKGNDGKLGKRLLTEHWLYWKGIRELFND